LRLVYKQKYTKYLSISSEKKRFWLEKVGHQ
jgi:hypothetical protein